MKYVFLIVFVLSTVFLAFIPEQSAFELIISGFFLAFASYYLLIVRKLFSFTWLLWIAIGLRVILLFSFPNLSDDIYRFIWDGSLLHIGQNPFAFLPSEYVNVADSPVFEELYPKLNSPNYFSVYPPFAQLIFYLSTFSWMNSVLVIKLFLLIAEGLTIYFGVRVLDLLKKDRFLILWYALNPLIMIEIMGNLHFEGFMVCFFVLFLYYMLREKLNYAALFMVLSISAKLLPLMFLPYFLFNWPWKKTLLFYAKLGVLLLLFFSPIVLQLSGFSESLDLYFRKFEFNASFYYVVRAVGEMWKGYNMIAKIGPILGLSVLVGILFLAYKVKDFFFFCQWALLLFLALSTTVHPWYLSLGIILSVFTGYRFFLLWSFLIVLSYAKYGMGDQLYYILIAAEYLIMGGFLLFELSSPKKHLL